MIKIKLNGVELQIFNGEDLLKYPSLEGTLVYPGLYINSRTTWGDIYKAAGYRSGLFDWAVPEDWAQHNNYPRAVWCYQEDKGCNRMFGTPVYHSNVLKELGRMVAEQIQKAV